MPAGFIGTFGPPPQHVTASARKRQVWVARRGVDHVWQDVAENVGVSKKKAHLYDSDDNPAFSLDSTLSQSERAMGHIERFCAEAIVQGEVDASLFVTGIVPFVAGLLVRHPTLATPTWSELGTIRKRSPSPHLSDRWKAFWRTADHILFNAKWTIIESQWPLMTTDLGFIWLPGKGRGTLHIPLHPFAVLQLTPGRSYFLGDKPVRIDSERWPLDAVLQSQFGMFVDADEVYGRDRDLVDGARQIMQSEEPVEVGGVDVRLLSGTRQISHIALMMGSSNPLLAWRRFHLAQHDVFDCRCAQENRGAGLSPDEIRLWDAQMEYVDAEARASVPRRGVVTIWDFIAGSAYVDQTKQLLSREARLRLTSPGR